MARNISLGGALKAASSAVTKGTKVRPAKKAKAPKAEKVKAAPEAKAPASSNLQSSFALKMAKAFRSAAGKPIAALSASIAVSSEKVVLSGISLQSLAHMAHRPGVKPWGKEPSISAKALDDGKVQFTPYGVARYAEAFKAK